MARFVVVGEDDTEAARFAGALDSFAIFVLPSLINLRTWAALSLLDDEVAAAAVAAAAAAAGFLAPGVVVEESSADSESRVARSLRIFASVFFMFTLREVAVRTESMRSAGAVGGDFDQAHFPRCRFNEQRTFTTRDVK